MPSDGTHAWKHGIYGYKRHGCRCGICRAAKARQNRRYRERTARLHAPTPPPPELIASPPATPPAYCREWDCERPAGPSGFCGVHEP